jgi:peptide-methionine (S)-S-oxide reductase
MMMKFINVFSILTTLVFVIISCAHKENSNNKMKVDLLTSNDVQTDTAILGTGCFWGNEAIFQQLKGVLKVTSGYSGGHVVNPTYDEVGTKNTGHAEVVQVIYDPKVISYDELLKVFWQTHDPTTLNRQGNDVGPQYRSVIFYRNNQQKEKAESYRDDLDKSGAWNKKIVTAVEPYKNFYSAEKYHQNYFIDNGGQPYCYYVIRPKLEKFEKVFREKIR